MTTNLEHQLNRIVERKSRATHLDILLQGYTLYARTEGKSRSTISITATAVTSFTHFLSAKGFPTDVTEIGYQEIREFILHLQSVKAYGRHPFTSQLDRGLSGHTINCYLRSLRAFWSWLVRDEILLSSPFAKIRIPKAPRKVIPTFSESQL